MTLVMSKKANLLKYTDGDVPEFHHLKNKILDFRPLEPQKRPKANNKKKLDKQIYTITNLVYVSRGLVIDEAYKMWCKPDLLRGKCPPTCVGA